ncbi:C12orf4 family protein [Megaselia abdita]
MNSKTVNFHYIVSGATNPSVSEEYFEPVQIPCESEELEKILSKINSKLAPVQRFKGDFQNVREQLKRFLKSENREYYDSFQTPVIENLDDFIVKKEQLYRSEYLAFSGKSTPTDDEIFAQKFHKLVHSDSLEQVIVTKKKYAEVVERLNCDMGDYLEKLLVKQQEEVEQKINQSEISATDINSFLTRQFSVQDITRQKLEANLSMEIVHQRNEFRNIVTAERSLNTEGSLEYEQKQDSKSSFFEESFTTHLGTQLKHMHNIRILNPDIKDFCSPLYSNGDTLGALNILIDLYSNSLCGLVVLTPSSDVSLLASPNIIQYCNMSTEFHFDQMPQQLTNITKNAPKLSPGDVFITKHSNLTQCHIIFHLVADEHFCRTAEEINSRHPVILGLRNIMKIASQYDVSSLTIPGLLKHDMSEDMTVPWCIRRAELVFKCAKGFVIEAASWGGAEVSTLQLLLPHDISEELFSSLAAMVPNIFRVSNSKILVEN